MLVKSLWLFYRDRRWETLGILEPQLSNACSSQSIKAVTDRPNYLMQNSGLLMQLESSYLIVSDMKILSNWVYLKALMGCLDKIIDSSSTEKQESAGFLRWVVEMPV